MCHLRGGGVIKNKVRRTISKENKFKSYNNDKRTYVKGTAS